MQASSVHQDKIDLIQSGNLTIYRFHDAPHRYVPDMITQGLVQALDWEPYIDTYLPTVALVTLPGELTVEEIAEDIKES